MDQRLIEIIPTLPLLRNPEDINEWTRIEQDLKVHGYKARRFLFAYSEIFNVDISRFRFSKYFSTDITGYRLLSRLLTGKKEALTLGQLEAAIPYGKLSEKVLDDIRAKQDKKVTRKKIRFITETYIKPQQVVVGIILLVVVFVMLSYIAIYLT